MVACIPSAYLGYPTHLEVPMEPPFLQTYSSPVGLSSIHIPYPSTTYLHPFRFPLLPATFRTHLVEVLVVGWVVAQVLELE